MNSGLTLGALYCQTRTVLFSRIVRTALPTRLPTADISPFPTTLLHVSFDFNINGL